MADNITIIDNLEEYEEEFQIKANEYMVSLCEEVEAKPEFTYPEYAARVMFLIFIITYEASGRDHVNPELNLEFMFFLARPSSTDECNTTLNELIKHNFIVDKGQGSKGEIYPDSKIDFDGNDDTKF